MNARYTPVSMRRRSNFIPARRAWLSNTLVWVALGTGLIAASVLGYVLVMVGLT